jgi:hypothetical protein
MMLTKENIFQKVTGLWIDDNLSNSDVASGY